MAEISAAVAEVFITDELNRRPPKSTDYLKEKGALQELARQMVDHPAEVLPRLVDLAIDLCEGTSGGISLFEENPAPGIFRWHHLRGNLTRFTGGTTPRDFSPCGVTLDLTRAVLTARPERVYTWLADQGLSLPECLLVPLYAGGTEPLGTLWIVSEHEGHFDSGHARVMTELAAFAGIAVRMVQAEQTVQHALSEQETLTKEMSHRIKNLFAITGGMIRLTAKSATTPADMSDILTGRLDALAAAHALVRRIFDDQGIASEAAELDDLVRIILRPHATRGVDRFKIEGPPVQLGDHSTNGLALVLHELATNAAKYGALTGRGTVTVTWRKQRGLLLIDWIERGGPVIDGPPLKTGFGSKLSETTVVDQFKGRIAHDWAPLGLSVAMSMPIVNLSH